MIVASDYEEISAGPTTPVGLTAAKVNKMGNRKAFVKIQVSGFPLAFTQHTGGAPTSTTLNQVPVNGVIKIEGRMNATQFLGLGIGGTSNLAVTYFIRQ